MGTNSTLAMGASAWAAPISVRERVSGGTGIAPNASCSRSLVAPQASLNGTGLPFAGYGTTAVPTGMTAAPQHTTLVAARKDDARVPLPRGRKR